jgi:lactate dehydrogenase-like 2-hydroxyacid dehydrogenase
MRKPELLLATPFSLEETTAIEADFLAHKLWEISGDQQRMLQIAPRIRGIATTGAVGASRKLMENFPKLEIVAIFGVGLDAVDLDYARNHGIRVTYTPDVLTDDVADMAIGLLLAVARQIPFGDRWVRSGRWQTAPMPLATSLHGKRIGILGLGRIGKAVALRAEAFGMEVLYSGRARQEGVKYLWCADAKTLAAGCDVLMVCAAGGATTHAIVDNAVLQELGETGILINVSRGSLIDETALITALRKGSIKGAGLDVFLNEPQINPEFCTFENVVLQTHNGSNTHETRAAIGALMRANLIAHFAGEPLPTPVI